MGKITLISWTDHTFNAWIGCTRWSDGCVNCYAERIATQKMKLGRVWGNGSTRHRTSIDYWKQPYQWDSEARGSKRRARVFCGSMMDWAEDHPDAEAIRPDLWRIIDSCQNLDWLLLTKRADRIRESLPPDWNSNPRANVWLGVSVESIKHADRIEHLRRIPAAVRFVSYEPALGPLHEADLSGIDWIIFGGESGPKRRPCELEWARQMRKACEKLGIAFFFKQDSALRTEEKPLLDGQMIREVPIPRR